MTPAEPAAASRSPATAESRSASASTETRMVTRTLDSCSVQLVIFPVISCLFGMITSLLSKSTIVVARAAMRDTRPEIPSMVTRSPIRTGRSASRIRPETKFAKISCKPNPSPTVTAAASHCTSFQRIRKHASATMIPVTTIKYLPSATNA